MTREKLASFLRSLAQTVEEEGDDDEPGILVFVRCEDGTECFVPEGVREDQVREWIDDYTITWWEPPEVN